MANQDAEYIAEQEPKPVPPSIIGPGHTNKSDTEKIRAIVLTARTPRWWWVGFSIAFAGVLMLFATNAHLLFTGVGIWGNNVPVGWGFDIVNFVWWIGIGHAGTLISAILLLLRQAWRTSINRFAEAMTLFAVACAGLYPLLHMGRPWFFYWLMPIPNTMELWPQFRSPLVWDVFAVSTYATVSAVVLVRRADPGPGDVPADRTLTNRFRTRLSTACLRWSWRNSALALAAV